MDHFHYLDQRYLAEEVPLTDIAAAVGTPCYVYSRATLERHWRVFDATFGDHPHQVCYSVKANSSLAVLDLLVRLGSGFDIVSGGELERVLRAGGNPSNIVFSGVGKSEAEIRRALQVGVAKGGLRRSCRDSARPHCGGLICERQAKALLGRRGTRSGFIAYEWFQYALEQYQLAIDCGDTRPTDVGDATLRWNACVRMIERHPHCVPAPEERAELGLE